MAAENPTWGEERIANELKLKLGIRVSPRTVEKYLRAGPVRTPDPKQRWLTFVHNHARVIVACDFFVVVTASFRTLYVFVILELGTRRILHQNVTCASPKIDPTVNQQLGTRCNIVTAQTSVAGWSFGEAQLSPTYECCTFRGSVVALDAATGKTVWKTFTIASPAHPAKKSKTGVQMYGPSGASVWSAPTFDNKRDVLYVATGNNYSDPPTETSDAVLLCSCAACARARHSRQV
jgi:hypothetical protein